MRAIALFVLVDGFAVAFVDDALRDVECAIVVTTESASTVESAIVRGAIAGIIGEMRAIALFALVDGLPIALVDDALRDVECAIVVTTEGAIAVEYAIVRGAIAGIIGEMRTIAFLATVDVFSVAFV